MKIVLYQLDNLSFRKEKLCTLNLAPDISVKDLRLLISNRFNLQIHTFQLITHKLTLKILMTDCWPLSFFIADDRQFLILQSHSRSDTIVKSTEKLLEEAVLEIKNNNIFALQKL